MSRRLLRAFIGLSCLVCIIPLMVIHIFIWIFTGKSLIESILDFIFDGDEFKLRESE